MNPRQTAFVKEYVVDHNATQAATRAGYSKKTAKSQGQRLLTNVDIAKAIRRLDAETSTRLEITHELVLEGLHGIATDPDTTASARVRAYELLGKHQGMFGDRLEITQIPDTTQVMEWIDAVESHANRTT